MLGLKTLGSFDFEGHSLLQFVRHCADTYLHSEEKEIRLKSVLYSKPMMLMFQTRFLLLDFMILALNLKYLFSDDNLWISSNDP